MIKPKNNVVRRHTNVVFWFYLSCFVNFSEWILYYPNGIIKLKNSIKGWYNTYGFIKKS